VSVEIFIGRLKKRLQDEIANNHAEMDKGKPHDEYMKLVGRNAGTTKAIEMMREVAKEVFGGEEGDELGEEDEIG
jgi:hypothetical protein